MVGGEGGGGDRGMDSHDSLRSIATTVPTGVILVTIGDLLPIVVTMMTAMATTSVIDGRCAQYVMTERRKMSVWTIVTGGDRHRWR